jgi:hypothetical protein
MPSKKRKGKKTQLEEDISDAPADVPTVSATQTDPV